MAVCCAKPPYQVTALKKLLPPHNRSVLEVVREEGICDQTLYNWRKQAKEQGG
ncbi:MAG: transposase, partial [Methylobacter sp.]|uniref:transposase n=1 Tax=Methylobacter sp. TaxID=2051955 RepID=UPI00258BC995